MKKSLLVAAAAAFALAAVVTLPAQAATAQEAEKCGVALHKLFSKFAGSIVKAPAKLCKAPSELSETAAKILEKLDSAVDKFNGKFSAATCDPDVPTPLVNGFTQTDIEEFLQDLGFGGTEPPGAYCDNIVTPAPI